VLRRDSAIVRDAPVDNELLQRGANVIECMTADRALNPEKVGEIAATIPMRARFLQFITAFYGQRSR
jgi:hypothetical protein